MKAVIQRVISCSMTVEGKTVFEQGKGLLVLVGVADGDTERDADVLSAKIVKMRIFGDENEKMNRSVTDIGGDIAVVPNFTGGLNLFSDGRALRDTVQQRFFDERFARLAAVSPSFRILRFSNHAGEGTAPILRRARLPHKPSGCLNISRRSRRMRSEK